MSYQGILVYKYAVITINTFTKFIGTMIDTGAFKCFIVGYNQFLAF